MADSKRGALRRDVRLTRSHLWAAASGTVLIALLSFWAGTHVGQGGEVPETLPGTYTGQAASEELVALLARVETAADTRGGVDQMTFPAALTQSSGGGVTNSEDVPAGRFHVQVARFSDVADARRLRDLLRAAEVQAWIAADLEGGVMHWRVATGGYADPAEADAGLGSLQEALSSWSGPAVDPQVIQR